MNRKMLAVSLATLAGAAVSASARPVIYSSGFESPPYTAGAAAAGQIIPGVGATGTVGPGQDGWIWFSSSVNSDRPHVIADSTKAFQGTNYMRVDTGSGFGAVGSTSTRSTFTYHQDATADALLAGNVLHVGVAVYIENIASATRVTSQDIFVYSSVGLLGGMRLQSNGIFAMFNGAGTGIGLSGATNDSWWRFDMYFDWSTGKTFYFINGTDQSGVLDGAGFARTFTPGNGYGEVDLIDRRFSSTTGNTTQGNVHRWDSLSVDYAAAPAPSSAALLGLGGLVAARRRRS